MNIPTNEQLNLVRKSGFRPGVVICLVYDKKLLMFYKKEHKLWGLPQGRIDNKEDPVNAVKRNLVEELGTEFEKILDYSKINFVDSDKMEFKPGRHEIDELFDDEGNQIPMIGKEYYFAVLNCTTQQFDITKAHYDQFFWLSFREAYFISDRIYQKGKKRITLKIINTLRDAGLIE